VAVEDDIAGLVEDAQVHRPGVQVDPCVESVLLRVEPHRGLRVRGTLRWVSGIFQHTRRKEAMMSIQLLQPTAAAILASRCSLLLSAAAAAERFRSGNGGIAKMHRQVGTSRLSRRTFRKAAALVAIVVARSSGPAVAQEPLLWGGLKPGPNAVGYRSLYRLDPTRQYDPEFAADPTKPPVHKPR